MVSELTRIPWDKCYDLNIYEFFNYVSFKLYKDKKQSEAMNEWKQNH